MIPIQDNEQQHQAGPAPQPIGIGRAAGQLAAEVVHALRVPVERGWRTASALVRRLLAVAAPHASTQTILLMSVLLLVAVSLEHNSGQIGALKREVGHQQQAHLEYAQAQGAVIRRLQAEVDALTREMQMAQANASTSAPVLAKTHDRVECLYETVYDLADNAAGLALDVGSLSAMASATRAELASLNEIRPFWRFYSKFLPMIGLDYSTPSVLLAGGVYGTAVVEVANSRYHSKQLPHRQMLPLAKAITKIILCESGHIAVNDINPACQPIDAAAPAYPVLEFLEYIRPTDVTIMAALPVIRDLRVLQAWNLTTLHILLKPADVQFERAALDQIVSQRHLEYLRITGAMYVDMDRIRTLKHLKTLRISNTMAVGGSTGGLAFKMEIGE